VREARSKRLTLIACTLVSAIVFVDQTIVKHRVASLREDLDASLTGAAVGRRGPPADALLR